MKYLEFDIKNMTISRTQGDKAALVSGALNYFGLHFNMDEEFKNLAGNKAVEFYKNRNKVRRDLVDNECPIPNEMLGEKTPFDMRVISGNMVATPWVQVSITESGTIYPEAPESDLPVTLDYVKTLAGENAVAMLRKGDAGMEFSQNGEDWENGVSGISDVPKLPKETAYLRKNGDWIPYEAPKIVQGLNGEASVVTDLAADADLSKVITKVNEIIGVLKARGVTI